MVSHLKAVSTLKASGSLVFGGTLFTQHLYVVKYHFKWMLHLGMSRSIGSALIGYRSASDHNRSYRIGCTKNCRFFSDHIGSEDRQFFRSDIFSDPIYYPIRYLFQSDIFFRSDIFSDPIYFSIRYIIRSDIFSDPISFPPSVLRMPPPL